MKNEELLKIFEGKEYISRIDIAKNHGRNFANKCYYMYRKGLLSKFKQEKKVMFAVIKNES